MGIGYIALRSAREERVNENVWALINGETPAPTPITTVTPTGTPEVLERYAAIYEENPDTIGWVNIYDTTISFVVMQTPEDPDKYLHLDFYGNYSANGTLYLDSHCDIWKSDNLLIYGHHMASGAMLGNMMAFANESYWENHRTLSFDTIYEQGEYEIVGAFYSRVLSADEEGFRYYSFYGSNSEEEFNEYRDFIYANRQYDTGVAIEYGDRLITLSTCAYHTPNGRFALVAKKIAPDEAGDTAGGPVVGSPEADASSAPAGQVEIADEPTPLAASPQGESGNVGLVLLGLCLAASGLCALTVLIKRK